MNKVILLLSILFFIPKEGVSQYANITYDSLFILGNEVYQKGSYKESEKIYRRAIEKYSGDKESKEWVIAAVGLGASILDQGKVNNGAAWIFKADSAITDQLSLEEQAYVKSNVGWATWWLEGAQAALSKYLEAMKLAEASEDNYRIAQISNSLSVLNRSLGQFNKAITYAKVANDYFQNTEHLFLLALSKSNLFAAYDELGFTTQAEQTLLESLRIKEMLGNPDLIASDYKKLGLFYKKKGEYDKSLVFLKKYLAVTDKITDLLIRSEAFNKIGEVYFIMQDSEKALDFFNRSMLILDQNNYLSKPETVSQIALTYQKLDQLDLARSLFNEALIIFEKDDNTHQIIDTYLKLVELELISGNQKDALVTAKKAQKMSVSTESKQLKARSYAALGKVHLKIGNSEQALQFSRKAFNIASIFKGYRLANYSIDLAKAYYKAENDSAFYYADFAFSEIEREQSSIYGDNLESSLFSVYAEFYDEVALWYLEKEQNIKKAFDITERGRSRVLLERLSFSESNFENLLDEPTLINIRQKEKNIDKIYRKIEATTDPKELGYLREELRNAEFEYQSFTNAIRLNNPKLNAFEQLPLASMADLQKKMTNEDAIIEYMIAKNNLVTFWITKADISYQIIEIDSLSGPLEYFSDKISDFRTAIQNQESIETLETLSRPLLEPLINPFLEKFPHINQVILVPTHSLSILPFDALYSNGSFLIERLNIKYLPSSSIYNSIQNPHRETSKEILAVAGSGFDSGTSNNTLRTQSSFASLPSSLLEIETISNVFTNYTALKNEQVTESIIKSLPLGEYRYLHFATHGIVNEKNPQQSGLIISKMNEFENSFGEDGYLNSLEVSNLTLNADLVVLSACNTAIGKLVEGEGLLGLQRSFFKAGASAVIVSLWNVYDKSTSVLMGDFYRNLNKYERLELGWWNRMKIYLDVYEPPYFGYKEKALRDAKLTMIDHPYYNHPVNWAPFILIGK